MKRLRDLPIPQDGDDNLFPDGQIRNETTNQQGTPVVREVYGDILTNVYAILRDAGIEFNDLEDNENNGYQLLKAFKKFSNELNDIEQVMSVNGTQISLNINLDLLPNNYLLLCRSSSSIPKGVNLTLSSQGSNSFTFESNVNINTNDTFIFVFSQNNSKFISLNAIRELDSITTPFDGVLSYNNTSLLYYLRDGFILSNKPKSIDIQQKLRNFSSNQNLILIDTVIHKSVFLSMCLNDVNGGFQFFAHDINDLDVIISEISFNPPSIQTYDVYMYADQKNVYLTNSSSGSNNDYLIDKYVLNLSNNSLEIDSSITLDSSFEASTNVVIKDESFFVLKNNQLISFDFDGSSAGNVILDFPNLNGQIFNFNNQIYYKNGDSSIPWQL